MLNFWLIAGIVITILVTYKGFTDGFKNWVFMYVFAVIAFLAYLSRKYMMKRYEKHLAYLEGEKQKNAKDVSK